VKRLLPLLPVLLALVAVRLWSSEPAEEWRLNRTPLPELSRRAAQGRLDAQGTFALATRLAAAGRDAEAEPLLRKLISLDPYHDAAYASLGTLLARTGRQTEAFQVLTYAVKRGPRGPEPYLALADLYWSRQAYPQAIRELQAAVRRDPRRDDAWYLMAQCFDELQQPTRAREALEQAARAVPRRGSAGRHARVQVDLARIRWKHGEPAAAEEHLRRALQVEPESPHAHYTMAEVLLSQPGESPERLARAEGHLRRALHAAPGYPPAHYQLGMIASRRGDWAAAAAEFEAALEVAPSFQEALFNLARAYDRLGRAGEARRLRERFARLSDQEQQILDLRTRIGFGDASPDVYLRLARAYRAVGDLDRAYETLTSLLQRTPAHAPARAERAEIARLMGRAEEAGR
jgi:tetratricopeptide (TPR) repeat protein